MSPGGCSRPKSRWNRSFRARTKTSFIYFSSMPVPREAR
eukprot:gene26510-biopygen16708